MHQPDRLQWEDTALLPSYCCRRYITCTESKWIVKKTQIRAHLKNIWLVIFKRIKIINVKKAERLISDWKRLEAQQLSTTRVLTVYICYKEHIRDNGQNMNGIWGLDGSNCQSQCPDIDDFIFVMQKDVLICKTYIPQYSGVQAYHVGHLLLNSSGKKRVVCTCNFSHKFEIICKF